MGITTGTAALIGGIASAGSGLASGIMGANAAGSAAAAQAQAAQKGMNVAGQNLQGALGAQTGATGQIQGLYQPYIGAGLQGLGSLTQGLAPGGALAQGWGQTFQAPSAAQAAATPGYQFTLQQGLNAAQNAAAARGTLLSGGAMKGLANYASGLASQTYQQTYNNALSGYQQNYQTWANNQANLYNRLMGLTGLGGTAAGNLASLTQTGAQNIGGLYNANTGYMAQLLGAQGAAQASGQIGAANAWAGGLNSLTSGLSQGLLGYAMGQGQAQQPWANLGSPTYEPGTPGAGGVLSQIPFSPGSFMPTDTSGLGSIYAGYNPMTNLGPAPSAAGGMLTSGFPY